VNPQLVTTTEAVDPVFMLIFGISLVMLVGITTVMIYFIVKYHHSKHPRPTSQVRYNVPLEIIWTVLPTLIVLGMFYYGWAGYLALRNVPEDALTVKTTGRMWSWTFEYENGKISDKLYVPVGRPIKVTLYSEDVLHSFFVPAFRVKRDLVPGQPQYAWFVAPEEGSYDIFCAEYCGRGHSDMITTVEAVPPEEFQDWLAEKPAAGKQAQCEQLFQKHGCLGCHSLDGSQKVGPTFQGLWGKEVRVTSDGAERTVTADADYIRRSIIDPNAEIVKGFSATMPSFEGRIPEDELETMIDCFKPEAEDGGQAAGAQGEELFLKEGCIGCHSRDGTEKTGPTFKGLYGKEVTIMRDGEEMTVTADEDYLERSIEDPQAEIVKGYPSIMPDVDLTQEQIDALVDYIKTLK